MSRIGKKPIKIPAGVKVGISGKKVAVEGPKGKLSHILPELINIREEGGVIYIERENDSKTAASLHGLSRTLVDNMVTGVTSGFSKSLDIVDNKGGYRVALKGKALDFNLGKSHPTVITPPDGIEFAVEGQHRILVKGIDKCQVGRVAAELRGLRKAEPYLGKGIRYTGERIVLKAGKTGKK